MSKAIYKAFITASALAAALALSASAEAATAGLDLFGVPLSGATTASVEAAAIKAGMKPIHDDRAQCKMFLVNGLLKGAKTFEVCGTNKGEFAAANYTFPSFLDTDQVGRIVLMVKSKYGMPDHASGNLTVGPVEVDWIRGGHTLLQVRRDWPSTTTYMTYAYLPGWKTMAKEITAERQAKKAEQYKKQSSAY